MSSLKIVTRCFAGLLLVLGAVWLLPRLRWIGFGVFGIAVVGLPLMFPLSLGFEATCWLANHKASAAHRLEIWGFVAERIRQRPVHDRRKRVSEIALLQRIAQRDLLHIAGRRGNQLFTHA